MRFTLPDLPGEHQNADERTAAHKGSYDALRAKLGLNTPPENKSLPKGEANHTSAEEDDGYEVPTREADEATQGLPPTISGPLTLGAKVVSWIMVPLVMPVVSMILLIFLTPLRQMAPRDRLFIILVTAGLNTFLPMLLIGILKMLGIVRDVGLNSRRERPVPYLISILGLGATAWFIHLQGAPGWLWGTFVGAAIATAICCVVNFWWKISAHATGAAGVIATIAVCGVTGNAIVPLQWWLFGACLLTGLMGSARVFLRRHTDLQVVCGFICGFVCVYFTSLIFNH